MVHDPIKMILHDLDWSGFLSYNQMLVNEKKILTEAVEIGEIDEKKAFDNQIKFYKSLIGKDVFLTDVFKKHNNTVQNNLINRLEEMKNE